jgi:hypothetical protein
MPTINGFPHFFLPTLPEAEKKLSETIRKIYLESQYGIDPRAYRTRIEHPSSNDTTSDEPALVKNFSK